MQKNAVRAAAALSILAAALLLFAVQAPAEEQKPMAMKGHEQGMGMGSTALDGQTFVGTMGKKGEATGGTETIHFQNGEFHSVACDAHGFTAAPYKATVKGGTTEFTAETTSSTEGSLRWKGTITGNMLTATATGYKDGKMIGDYWVKAQMQQ